MPERDGNRKGRGAQGRWARYSRTASFWVLLILIPVFMYKLFMRPSEQAVELTYSQFSQQLERANVQKVTVIDGQRVEGNLRQPVRMPVDDQPTQVKAFWTRLPFKDDGQLLPRLEGKGVDITGA